MSNFTILYDEPHEAEWFRRLHPDFTDADEESITSAAKRIEVQQVLAYDRPDIILLDAGKPVLVVEETVEVPSGHNVGQRFARLAAAAEAGVPVLYFGPYVAKKHGGETSGPRFMNVRLFQALDAMVRVTGTAVTTINWPVDERCEVRRDHLKDVDVRHYIELFLQSHYSAPRIVSRSILASPLQSRLRMERDTFVRDKIKRSSDYDLPPNSVEILGKRELLKKLNLSTDPFSSLTTEIIFYQVGMNNIRSDPYTGMGILYRYLYVHEFSNRKLVFWFPNISIAEWKTAASRPSRKDIKLFKIAADGIQFSDGFLLKANL